MSGKINISSSQKNTGYDLVVILPSRVQDVLLCCMLAAAIAAAYGQVTGFDFISLDDDRYVFANPQVLSGLNRASVVWAFSAFHVGTWQPLVWLSYMFDVQIYGVDAGGFHLSNLVLHVANSLLLFAVLRLMTGARWRSALVAALFGLHPLHVESVAWVAERKDVLSAFFWMLSLLAYGWYVKRKVVACYALVLLLFVLGLMAKPMVVTLPCVLILMDFWPLRRFGAGGFSSVAGRLLLEKTPFFILALLGAALAIAAQQSGGAISSLDHVPMELRFANAAVSYMVYLRQVICPVDLAVMYPYAGMPPWAVIAGAVLLLLVVTGAVLRWRCTWPYGVVGWFWYLGTLAPVIGLLQFGMHARADRFTYIPLVGFYMFFAWGIAEVVRRCAVVRWPVIAAVMAILLGCVMLTRLQVRHWEGSITLFKHTLSVTENNYLIHNNLGVCLKKKGLRREALRHFQEAVRIHPDYALAHNNLGATWLELRGFENAIGSLRAALKIRPGYASAHHNLGDALALSDDEESALSHYLQALRLQPENAVLHNKAGDVLVRRGSFAEACKHYAAAISSNPAFLAARNNLGIALVRMGKLQEAIAQFEAALRINPAFQPARANLDRILGIMQQR